MTTTIFWAIAGLMALVAAAPLYLVLRKGSEGSNGSSAGFAAVVAVAFLGASVGTYVYLSDYDFDSVLASAGTNDNPHASDAQDAIAELAASLEENPDDVEGWKFLGRSYRAQERYREAARAFERAYELADDDPAVMLDLGEAILFADSTAITGRAGQLFENALQLAPNNARALWYAGLAAANRGERLLAADRWEQILDTAPPDDVRQILESNIRELRAAAGAGEGDAGAPMAAAAEMPSQEAAPAAAVEPEPEPEPEPAAPPVPAADVTPGTVPLQVTLSPELASQAPADAPLFVFARTPGVGGPPIAAVRLRAGDLPLSITLSDANAMMAGRQISTQEEVELVARVAKGGSISESEGDLIGETTYRMDSGETARLVIDQVVGR
ncbi:tetratricopeptide repeat protein [Lentisalinibacter orientalis]|uniref:tetratricopeptide repeat protein n=1 Tax=Lentisalinibacter orientalis TaxID=2992241 RepID=UPI00386D4237